MTRLTFFDKNPKFKCTQGVVSDNGQYIAFQISKTTDTTGLGYGILLMDLDRYLGTHGINLN